MKILVTGATGFIGRNLVMRLLQRGEEVICMVRKTSNLEFLKDKNVTFAIADIRDEDQVEDVFARHLPEVVYHSSGRVKDEAEENLFKVNVSGTKNICQACYKHGIARLIYLSSVAVISGNTDVPLTENLPYKATSAYGRSKIEGEKIALDFRKKGLKTVIIRPCMVYGEDEPHAMGKIFYRASRRRIPTTDLSNLHEKLHIGYINNIIDILELALEREEALEGTFMVADKEVTTIRKSLDIITDELGAPKPVVIPGWMINLAIKVPFFKKKFDRIFKDRVYDISHAVDVLGYAPKISTEEGLRRSARNWKEKKISGYKKPDLDLSRNI